ncbi:MAG: M1 family aminopeptidase [Bryobacteraceae bacterium]
MSKWIRMDGSGGLRAAILPVVLTTVLAVLTPGAMAQDSKRPKIDVEHYTIEAEINPATQSIAATAAIRFVPEETTSFVIFELNNALTVSAVTDGGGQPVSAQRNSQEFAVRAQFQQPLEKGKPQTVIVRYEGKLDGSEESPVWGVKFASIQSDYAFLLYPARWFPVNDYTADRFTATVRVTVPDGYHAIGSGLETSSGGGSGKITYEFEQKRPSFPGSIGVAKGQPFSSTAGGARSSLYFRGETASMANAYGEEVGKAMTFLTGLFGLPPDASMIVFETENNAPNGYSAPGLLFLNPRAIGTEVNSRLVHREVARQWWGVSVSPTTRNHIWLANGGARYAELMWVEKTQGEGAMESELRDTYTEALTVEQPPIAQSSRLEDYSPEYWAVTAAKGAAVFNMLRQIAGDEAFEKLLKTFLEANAGKEVSTDDFRKAAEQITGRSLQGFFIQWIESTGAPEFKLEYTVFRTTKGFRVMGKVAQDLDTFRMPVELLIETDGNPETKTVDVVGMASEFVVETFGRPKKVTVDPNYKVLRYHDQQRVAVAIRRGEMFAEISEWADALKEYQKALDTNRNSSLAHYRVAEIFFLQGNYQSAANEFREALNGDLEPKWTEVWTHLKLGNIFDITDQRERATNEYNQAIRTKDNTQGAQELAAKYLKEPYQRPARNY